MGSRKEKRLLPRPWKRWESSLWSTDGNPSALHRTDSSYVSAHTTPTTPGILRLSNSLDFWMADFVNRRDGRMSSRSMERRWPPVDRPLMRGRREGDKALVF